MPVREHWKLLLGRGSRRASSSRAPDQAPGSGSPLAERLHPGTEDCDAPLAQRRNPGRGGLSSAVRGEHARGSDWVQRDGANCGSPGRVGNGRTLTRVRFLGSGLVAAAGALGGYAAQAQAAETVQVWGLDPNWAGDPSVCACSTCASCLGHASNKLFASAASADSGRAHPYCKCLVVPLARLDVDVYDSLFLDGGRTGIGRPAPSVGAGRLHARPPARTIVVLVAFRERGSHGTRRARRARPGAHPARRQRPAGALCRHRLRADPDRDARDHPPGPDRRAPGHPGRERAPAVSSSPSRRRPRQARPGCGCGCATPPARSPRSPAGFRSRTRE